MDNVSEGIINNAGAKCRAHPGLPGIAGSHLQNGFIGFVYGFFHRLSDLHSGGAAQLVLFEKGIRSQFRSYVSSLVPPHAIGHDKNIFMIAYFLA